MPPVVAFALLEVAAAAGWISTAAAVFGQLSVIYGAYQQSRARRKARDAYNNSLKDRLVTVSTVDGFRSRVYGRARNVDGVLFKATRGDKSQYYTLFVALAGHECDAIESVYFNDTLLALDANGYVLSEPWNGVTVSNGSRLFTDQEPITIVNGAGSVTLPNAPIAATVVINLGDTATTAVSVVGNVVSVSGWADYSGAGTVSYQYNMHASAATAKARVRKFLGGPGQDLSTVLAPLFPGLITAGQHRFEGICGVLVDLEYDPDAYPTGVPSISAIVRGAKVLDRRTGVTAWSQNPALIADDWARYSQGGGALEDELVTASFITAANACDVSHSFTSTNAAGASITTPRPMYTCNIVCRTDADPSDSLSAIVESMAGAWAWTGGQLRVKAGAYSAPVATLTESWCSGEGDIELLANAARTDLVNVYTATIADERQDYVAVPLPRWPKDSANPYIAADGGELPSDIQLEGVTDVDHAQHVLGVMLRDQRQGLSGSIPCNLRAYPVEVFDTIALDLPRFGFAGKTVQVLGWQFSQQGGVVLRWKETSAAIYDPDAAFERSDPSPNTALPSPFYVPTLALGTPLSGTAQLLRQADGTVVSRVLVSWAAVQDAGVLNGGAIEVRYGRAGVPFDQWQSVTVPGSDTQVYLGGVQDLATYTITARARNRLVAGDWAPQQIHRVIGKTASPTSVTGLAAAIIPGAVRITWAQSPDVDYELTKLRHGASWAAGTQLPFNRPGTSYDWLWPAPGTYTLWAVHVDTTGNESAPVSTTVTVTMAALAPSSSALGIKLNAYGFEGLNYNEAYLHGFDASGAAIDAPGAILVNGVSTPVPNGSLFTNLGPAAGYIVWDSAGATFTTGQGMRPYVFARRHQGQWQYDDNSTGWVPFTPASTHWVLGTLESGGPDTGNPGAPPGLTRSSIYAAAAAPSQVAWDELAGRPADSELLNGYVAIGKNLLPNSDQATCTWVRGYTPNGATFDYEPQLSRLLWADTYSLASGTTQSVTLHQNGNGTVTNDGTASRGQLVACDVFYGSSYGGPRTAGAVPVVAGQRIIGSVYAATHRCDLWLFLQVLDASGNVMSYPVQAYTFDANPLTDNLANFTRMKVAYDVPSGAVAVKLLVRKFDSRTDGHSWVWLAAPMIEVASANQTDPSPYNPGAPSDTRQLGYTGPLDATKNNIYRQPTAPAYESGATWLQVDGSNNIIAIYFGEGGAWRTGPVGPQGAQGIQGPAGANGANGANGQTSYFHVAYASSADGSVGFNQTGGAYIGTYVDFSPADSADYRAYAWRQFVGSQGATGAQGIPGTNGANGQTSYLHIKYSNDGGASFTANGGEDVGAYIGTYVDFTAADSTAPGAYQWATLQAPDYEQESQPAGAPPGSTWRVPSTGRTYVLIGGSWKPYVGNGSVDTAQLAGSAATDVTEFTFANFFWSNIA